MNVLSYNLFRDFLNYFQVHSYDFSYIQVGPEWQYHHLTNPFNRLYFITSGRAFVSHGEVTTALLPGHAYLMPACQTFDYSCSECMEKFYHHFNLLLPDGHDLFENVSECLELAVPTSEMYEALCLPGAISAESLLRYQAFLSRILARFVFYAESRGYSFEFPQYPPQIMETLTFISVHLSARLRLADCAAHLNISPSALTKLFRSCIGTTVTDFIHQALIRKAKEMLFSDATIKEISAVLQFGDQYYFSRFFSKHEGMSPSRYREINSMKLYRHRLQH